MKKVIKNRMFLVIIITIIVTSVSVYAATTYKATDVIYKASDGTSMNVNDALNELYESKISSGSNNLKKGTSKLDNRESITLKFDFEPNFIATLSNNIVDVYNRSNYWKCIGYDISNVSCVESVNGTLYSGGVGTVKIDGNNVIIQNWDHGSRTIDWYIGRYE